jgi:CubicO group peptidase (beta-lactamase class C family)
MTRIHAAAATLLVFSTLSPPIMARGATLPERLDAIAAEAFAKDGPGGSVIVVQDGMTLLRKGYGMADLELGVPVRPEMVFRIGSMGKQFTAVAILQLVKEGKVKFDDPLSKYVPDFPGAEAITVEQLLTHTSGIRSYNDVPSALIGIREDKTPMQLVDGIRNEKPAFAPGESWMYSNSGYLFLGIIIEKASGMKYADYMQTKLFTPLGLKNTFVEDESQIVAGRVKGYAIGPDNVLRNAGYMNMTQPYAAGAIETNVDDLARWNELLVAGKVIDKALLDRAWTDSRTKDGKPTGYGYGWYVSDEDGVRFVVHGGAITGFRSHGVLVPKKRLFVGVLHNALSSGNDMLYTLKYITTRLALEVLGQSWGATPVPMSDAAKSRFTGIYVFDGMKRTVRFEDGILSAQQEGGPPFELIPVAKDEFVYDKAFSRLKFSMGSSGAIDSVVAISRGQPTQTGKRVADAPAARKAITLAEAKLDRLLGVYEVEPGFQLTITREGTHLFMQATGQGRAEAFAESETKFFFKVVDAQIEFAIGDDGRASVLTLFQGGAAPPAKRVK